MVVGRAGLFFLIFLFTLLFFSVCFKKRFIYTLLHEIHTNQYLMMISFFRALSFIHVFLQDVLTGEQDLCKCATKAYEQSLKKFHGWMVQKIFSVRIFEPAKYEQLTYSQRTKFIISLERHFCITLKENG